MGSWILGSTVLPGDVNTAKQLVNAAKGRLVLPVHVNAAITKGEEDYRDLQLTMCGDMARLQRKYELRGSFVSFREIYDLNFRGSFDFIRLYDEIYGALDLGSTRFVLLVVLLLLLTYMISTASIRRTVVTRVNIASLIFEGRLVLPVHVNTAITKG
ncbi:hypothetical protein Tco_1300651 [Tanacetum coccineum]